MKIVGKACEDGKDGKRKGVIKVKDGRREHIVRFDGKVGGHCEQWGAPTEVLCFTYASFAEMMGI